MLNATIITTERNGEVFADTPPEVEAVVNAWFDAVDARSRARDGFEYSRLSDAVWFAKRHAEDTLEAIQGRRIPAFYRIRGHLVGFGKVSKGGFELITKAACWSINHPQSKRGKR